MLSVSRQYKFDTIGRLDAASVAAAVAGADDALARQDVEFLVLFVIVNHHREVFHNLLINCLFGFF